MNLTWFQVITRLFCFVSTDVCDEQVEPLDALMIHPEMYDQTQDILNSHGFTTKDLGQRPITSYFKEKLKNNGEAWYEWVSDDLVWQWSLIQEASVHPMSGS